MRIMANTKIKALFMQMLAVLVICALLTVVLATIPELTVEQNIVFPVLLDYQKPNEQYLEGLLSVLSLKGRRSHLISGQSLCGLAR